MVHKVSTVMCQTSNMDRSVAFYRDVLGLSVETISPYWSSFKIADVTLGLHPIMEGAAMPLGLPLKGWYLGLEVDDLMELHQALIAFGSEIRGDYHEIPGGILLEFADPDGNTIQAIQKGTVAEVLKGSTPR